LHKPRSFSGPAAAGAPGPSDVPADRAGRPEPGASGSVESASAGRLA